MTFRIVANDVSLEIAAAFSGKELAASNSMVGQIAIAATGAIRDAGDLLKDRVRANIAGAGFGTKWQNAWRVTYYPRTGVSIDAAVWAFHKIPYSIVFEDGARILPKSGKLWLGLPTVPKVGRRRATPRQLAQRGVKLVTIKQTGKKPLLAASIRVPQTQTDNKNLSVSLSKLRKGTEGKRGVIRAVPLFVGVDSVNIKKKFNIAGITNGVRGQIGELYLKNLQPE